VVIEQVGEMGFARAKRLAHLAVDKGPCFVDEGEPRQTLKYVENLLGILFICDELTKVMQGSERPKLRRLAIGVAKNGFGHWMLLC
jgi:hypothetical protein